MVNSLRKVDFSHPTVHYTWEKIRPSLEKILGAPLPTNLLNRDGAAISLGLLETHSLAVPISRGPLKHHLHFTAKHHLNFTLERNYFR